MPTSASCNNALMISRAGTVYGLDDPRCEVMTCILALGLEVDPRLNRRLFGMAADRGVHYTTLGNMYHKVKFMVNIGEDMYSIPHKRMMLVVAATALVI